MSNLLAISGKQNSGKDTVGKIIQYLDYCKRIEKDGTVLPSYSLNDFLNDNFPNYYQHNWKIKKFADKLKDIVCILIGCTREQLEDREFKNTPLPEEWDLHSVYVQGKRVFSSPNSKSAIKAAEKVNTGVPNIKKKQLTPRKLLQLLGTDCGRDIIHPNLWVLSLFSNYTQNSSKWIITDLRFPNEAKAIKDRDGILIRVDRDVIMDNEGNPIRANQSYTNISTIKHPSETALDDYKDWDYVIDNNGSLDDLFEKVKDICNKENIL